MCVECSLQAKLVRVNVSEWLCGESKSPFPVFRLLSEGLKWMVGMGQTSSIGLGSTRVPPFLSHPAPSRNSPLTHTPSLRGGGGRKGEWRYNSISTCAQFVFY